MKIALFLVINCLDRFDFSVNFVDLTRVVNSKPFSVRLDFLPLHLLALPMALALPMNRLLTIVTIHTHFCCRQVERVRN